MVGVLGAQGEAEGHCQLGKLAGGMPHEGITQFIALDPSPGFWDV